MRPIKYQVTGPGAALYPSVVAHHRLPSNDSLRSAALGFDRRPKQTPSWAVRNSCLLSRRLEQRRSLRYKAHSHLLQILAADYVAPTGTQPQSMAVCRDSLSLVRKRSKIPAAMRRFSMVKTVVGLISGGNVWGQPCGSRHEYSQTYN